LYGAAVGKIKFNFHINFVTFPILQYSPGLKFPGCKW
jgi:hypothetical protein